MAVYIQPLMGAVSNSKGLLMADYLPLRLFLDVISRGA